MVDRKRSNKGRLDEECKKELEKNESRKKMIRHKTEEVRNDYSIKRKITKKLLREKKRNYYED